MTHPLDVLEKKSKQSHLVMKQYHFLKADGHVEDIQTPDLDKNLAALALLGMIRGESVGILYPFPESDNAIFPLLGPLAHLLVGAGGHYVVVSRARDWGDFYGRIQKSKEAACYYDRLKPTHPHGTVGMDGVVISHASGRDYTRKINLLFSRRRSTLELRLDEHVSGLVIDTGSPRSRIDSHSISELIDFGIERQIPVVVYFTNPNSSTYRILKDRNIPILSWNKTVPSGAPSDTVVHVEKLPDSRQDSILQFLALNGKTTSAPSEPDIIITIVNASDTLKELNLRLHQLLESVRRKQENPAIQNLAAYSSFLESLMRNMWTRKSDFEEAATHSFGRVESLQSSAFRLNHISKGIYETDAGIGAKAIQFAEQFHRAIEELEVERTEKSMLVERMARDSTAYGSVAFCSYGRVGQSALNLFLECIGGKSGTFRSISPYNLPFLPSQKTIIFPGMPLNIHAHTLLNSSSREVIIMCYPWEVDPLKGKIERLRKTREVCISNAREFMASVLGASAHETNTALKGREIRTQKAQDASGEKTSRVPRAFDIGNLLDYLEMGESPECSTRTPDDRVIEFRDHSPGRKLRVVTDKGVLYLNEDRQLTVVYQTYSEQLRAIDLRVGDIILVGRDFNPRPMGEYVWDTMARRGLSREGAIWRQWKSRLRDFVKSQPGEDYRTVFEKLKESGGFPIETPAAVYVWLNSEDLIGPQERDTILCIGRLLGASEAECEIWWAAIRQVRSALQSAYCHLWKLTKHYASNLASGDSEDVLISPELDIWLSDLADLITFAKVINPPELLGT